MASQACISSWSSSYTSAQQPVQSDHRVNHPRLARWHYSLHPAAEDAHLKGTPAIDLDRTFAVHIHNVFLEGVLGRLTATLRNHGVDNLAQFGRALSALLSVAPGVLPMNTRLSLGDISPVRSSLNIIPKAR